jgi:hypothetical protein
MKVYLKKLIQGKNLTADEMKMLPFPALIKPLQNHKLLHY